MAGSGAASGFDATQFRDAIHFAMNMGLPDDASQRVTFIFDEVSTYQVTDPRQRPYDWKETKKTDVSQRSVQVPAAVQWGVGTVAADEMGQFDTSRATITLLDNDYALVKGCNEVLINGIHYVIEAWAPPQGLFDVTVFSASIVARG